MEKVGLYIHIPFCKQKCKYCDFNSYSGKESQILAYINNLKSEILNSSLDAKVATIFIGGGTPSYIESRYIVEILNLCRQKFDINENAEITIETNPGTLDGKKLEDYIESGINRLSMGLQSTDNRLLKALGRIHSFEEFLENYKLARRVGFENINIDLMLGLPEQLLDDVKQTLDIVVDLKPEHLSCYSLQVEEGTPFFEMYENGVIKLPEQEIERDMYHYAIDRLKCEGYNHYEISNFAKSGFECKHNLIYWNCNHYLGLGSGAFSYLNDERFHNTKELVGYTKVIDEKLSLEDKMSEFVIMGLRLIDGFSISEFASRFGKSIFDVFGNELRHEGIVIDCDRIRLKSEFIDLANQVMMEFC